MVAAEVCNAANDSTQFQAMVAASYRNLADIDAEPIDAVVADASYWNPDNVTLDIAAEVLIAPMPATSGITDPTDPRIAQRKGVVERLDRGDIPWRRRPKKWGYRPPGLANCSEITAVVDPTRPSSETPCWNGSPATPELPHTPNAKPPSNLSSGTSKPTSGSGDSQGEDSTPRQMNGGSFAPSTTCSRSNDTDSPPSDEIEHHRATKPKPPPSTPGYSCDSL